MKSKLIVTRHLLWIFALASAALARGPPPLRIGSRPAPVSAWRKPASPCPNSPLATPPPSLSRKSSTILWSAILPIPGSSNSSAPASIPRAFPGQPAELKAADWSGSPASAYMVAYGNLSAAGGALAVSAWLSDVRNAGTPPALSKIYRGQPPNRTPAPSPTSLLTPSSPF